MFKNYFTTALRNFLRQKTYSFINVAGLSVGLACSFLIFMWAKHEIMYDRFHEQGTQIYRVMRNYSANDKIYTWSAAPMPLAKVLVEEYPEITHDILITRQRHLLSKGDESFRETGIYASPSFFNVFTFPLLQGDARTILAEPNAIAISEKLAGKYFGPDWASQSILGQILTVEHRKEFTIKAVFRDVPGNSSLRFEFVLPLEKVFKKFNPNYPLEYRFMDEDFERMYSREKMLGQLTTTFAVLAIFISCLGLFGLASFTAEQRTKEIGIRKILGASVTNLILLLSREFSKLVVIAFVLAIPLAYYSMTMWLNAFAYRINIGLEVFVFAGGASFIVAWLTVSYQALKVASANPVEALRNE